MTSCAEKPINFAVNYCSDGDYQNCDAKTDAGDCIEEAGCKHPVVLSQDTYLGEFSGNQSGHSVSFADGYVGRIDSGCRSLKKDKFGGDVDWIAVMAKPGTPLKASVSHDPLSLVKPVVYLHNRAGGELIYSLPDDYGQASVSFLAPEELFYISIEENANYEFDYQSKCSDSNIKGGEDYVYSLKITNTKIKISDIGLVRSTASTKGKLTEAGQSQYYSVKIPVSSSLGVTLKTTNNSRFDVNPVLSPLSSSTRFEGGSDYSWIYAGEMFRTRTTTVDYISVFKDEIISKYASCDDSECEYLLAVTDYNSAYDYEYELTVQAK